MFSRPGAPWSVVMLAVIAACGSDGPPSVTSGVPGSTVLGGMNAESLRKVCDSVDRWGKQAGMEAKLKEFGCRMRGNVVAALVAVEERQQVCTSLYDPCAQAPAPTAAAGAACTAPPSSCSATVGELETCLAEMPLVIDQLLEVLPTCPEVATVSGNPIATALTKIPSSCQALNAKCAGWDKLPGSAPASPAP
jgi:hypothetical protein